MRRRWRGRGTRPRSSGLPTLFAVWPRASCSTSLYLSLHPLRCDRSHQPVWQQSRWPLLPKGDGMRWWPERSPCIQHSCSHAERSPGHLKCWSLLYRTEGSTEGMSQSQEPACPLGAIRNTLEMSALAASLIWKWPQLSQDIILLSWSKAQRCSHTQAGACTWERPRKT